MASGDVLYCSGKVGECTGVDSVECSVSFVSSVKVSFACVDEWYCECELLGVCDYE